MAKRKSRNKKIRLAAIAAALSTGGIVIALLPSANADQRAPQPTVETKDAGNCQRNHFHVKSSDKLANKWSVRGDLKDGKGKQVYHWEELDKDPGHGTFWEFTYCGDNGKGHIWIDVAGSSRNPQRHSYLNLDLSKNYCWEIVPYTLIQSAVIKCVEP